MRIAGFWIAGRRAAPTTWTRPGGRSGPAGPRAAVCAIYLALLTPGASAQTPGSPSKNDAPKGKTASAVTDSLVHAAADSLAMAPVAGLSPGDDGVIEVPGALPGGAAPASAAAAWSWPAPEPPPVPGQPIAGAACGRRQNDRVGARTSLELLAMLPGHHAPQAAAAIEIGALAAGGSFGSPRLEIDGWEVRLPRLEGRDLAAPLLDRLGPHAGYATYASVGSLMVATVPPAAPAGRPLLQLEAREPVPGSGALSRVALYRGGFGVTGGGVTLADRRSDFDYRLGMINAKGGRGGGVADLTTRLATIDAGWDVRGRRVELSARGSERDLIWKSGAAWNQDDQGLGLAIHGGQPSPLEWSLQTRVSDDRLSGTTWPDLESKRKSWQVESVVTHRGNRLYWGRLRAERDWLSLRTSTGVLAPCVERARAEGGVATPWLGGAVHGELALALGDRHPRRLGGGLGWRRRLTGRTVATIDAVRAHRPPTLDQEILWRGRPVAEPERHDAVTVRIEHAGRWTLAVAVARRHLGHVPEIVSEDVSHPWPLYDFRLGESAHWALEGGLLSPPAALWQARIGIQGSVLEIDGARQASPAFVPRYLARGYLTASLALLEGDLVLLPRLDALLVGDRHDFSDRSLPEYVRIDATLVAVVVGPVDLELSLRNLTDRRYALPVIEPTTGELYLDSGRMTVLGIRWNLLD